MYILFLVTKKLYRLNNCMNDCIEQTFDKFDKCDNMHKTTSNLPRTTKGYYAT